MTKTGANRSFLLSNCFLIPFFAIALLTVLWFVYRVAFDAPFYFDTIAHLQTKTNLHVVKLSWGVLWDAMHLDYGLQIYRPLSNLTLAFTHYFARLDPRAYRIGNLVIHWAASLSLLFLFLSVAKSPRVRERHPDFSSSPLAAALIATALWSLHPIQTNVATYVIQRMASLAGLFSFFCIGSYVRARSHQRGWSTGWGILFLLSFVLALASKENSILLLPMAALAELVLLEQPPPPFRRRALLLLSVGGIALVAIAAWKGPSLWQSFEQSYQNREFTPGERVLTEIRLQLRYIVLLLLPDARPLTLDAQIEVSKGLFQPGETAAAAVAVSLSLGLAFLVRRKQPLLCFGILWFFLAQATEATIVPLELYYEHRLYVPSAFLYLAMGAFAARFAATAGYRRAEVALCLLPWMAASAFATYSRNVTWSNPVLFWADDAAKAPNNPRPYTNLGVALVSFGHLSEGERALKESLALGGEKDAIYYNLAAISRKRGDMAAAKRYLELAIRARGENVFLAYRALASLVIAENDYNLAQRYLSAALRLRPGDAESWNLLGTIHIFQKDFAKAAPLLQRAVRYAPTSGGIWNNLGVLRYETRDFGAAEECFARAVSLDPQDAQYRINLAKARRERIAAASSPPVQKGGSSAVPHP